MCQNSHLPTGSEVTLSIAGKLDNGQGGLV
ncbi:putative large exoprotein, partial [Pseudomonas phage vB_Pae_CF28a]